MTAIFKKITQEASDALRAESISSGRVPVWVTHHAVDGSVLVRLDADIAAHIEARYPGRDLSELIMELVYGEAR
ncbi:MAG: hypothetical protein ABJA80_01955 [bacterium]